MKISLGKKSIFDSFSSQLKIQSKIYIQLYLRLKGNFFNLLPSESVFPWSCFVWMPQKITPLWNLQSCHIHIGDISEEMVKFYDICFEVRKSVRVWFSFSLLWKCETVLQLVLTARSLKFWALPALEQLQLHQNQQEWRRLLLRTATRAPCEVRSGPRARLCKTLLQCRRERGLSTVLLPFQVFRFTVVIWTLHFIQRLAY